MVFINNKIMKHFKHKAILNKQMTDDKSDDAYV